MSVKNDNMQSLFAILLLTTLTAQIPITEQKLLLEKLAVDDGFFDQENIQGSSWRTVGYDEVNDLKTIFFLDIDSNNDNKKTEENEFSRAKRQTDKQIVDVKLGTGGEELSTQRQDSDSQDTLQLSTETAPPTTEIGLEENEFSKNNFIPINDFIRFRRESSQKTMVKHEGGGANSDGQSRSFELGHENDDAQSSREPRGLSTQQWVKFPYQVQRSQKPDSFGESSDFAKPRRVQFVTQKQFQVENPSASPNSRQGRVSDQARQPGDQPREARLEPDISRGRPSYTPRFRDFDDPSDYPFRSSRGRYYERDLMERRPDSRSFEFYPRNRDRRIIYYANLPEITRELPRFGEMGRFRDYRDPFEDRYRGGQYRREFYRDRANEEMHPMKVSADINVRDVKKNPEKRIYSDVKRKYGYDAPTFDSDQTIRH